MTPSLPFARCARPAPAPLLPAPILLAPILLAALSLAGCAAPTTRFPSLLPRAIETRSDAAPELVLPIAEPEPTTDAALDALRATLDRTVADFAPAADRADKLAATARGDAVGGERWIAAQSALADLDVYQATVSATLADIDALALARAADGKPDYPALGVLHRLAQSAFDTQTARIATIAARLPQA